MKRNINWMRFQLNGISWYAKHVLMNTYVESRITYYLPPLIITGLIDDKEIIDLERAVLRRALGI